MATPSPELRVVPTTMRQQNTYLLKDLEIGRIYRNALSGYLVLVQKRGRALRGLFWNPVTGTHDVHALHDHLLIAAEHATDLKADTRHDTGHHR